jgi:hypothetical protein
MLCLGSDQETHAGAEPLLRLSFLIKIRTTERKQYVCFIHIKLYRQWITTLLPYDFYLLTKLKD